MARDLKYRTFETDFGALAKELHGDQASPDDADIDDYDEWSDYAEPRRD